MQHETEVDDENGIEYLPGDTCLQKYQRKGKRGAKNYDRHKILVRWIATTFPESLRDASIGERQVFPNLMSHALDSLTKHPNQQNDTSTQETVETGNDSEYDSLASGQQQPQHILDIAGGKGELSSRLSICHKARVLLIDPRVADFTSCFEKVVFKSLPKKWQERINTQLIEDPNFLEKKLDSMCRQMTVNFSYELVNSSPELQEAVRNASLLVGLHADVATEDIVQIALQYRKPFVVVPCCVFPNLFRTRVVQVGRNHSFPTKSRGFEEMDLEREFSQPTFVPVRNHAQFCFYLLQKDSHFLMDILSFEGRNVAIWWDGKHLDTDQN